MLLIIFLIIFFIYVEKTAWRDKDNPPMTRHELDVANGGGGASFEDEDDV